MPEPIIENIAAAIQTQLGKIKTQNGYATTVAGVVRPKRRADRTSLDNNIVLEQGERRLPDSEANNRRTWVQPFLIHLVVRPGDSSTDPIDKLINRFVADVEKAFPEVNTPDWYVDGLIHHTLTGPAPLPDAEDFDGAEGATMILEVTYRHSLTDPYEA